MGIDNGTAGPGSPASLREQNRARILAVLASAGELSQADIARHTQLAPATVSAIVQELRTDGAVAVTRGEGRRHLVKLTGAAGLFLGIDYGHRHVTVAVATDGRNILAEARSDFDREMSARDGIARIGEAVETVVAEARISRSDIVGAAMGLPAPIDAETGRVGS
ncbi:MAG: winged helix-turn-helix domain-containing protein, partial [Solirubrobacteraceae bacterium]|nr:winged helix-turn-helix domain-containing protein [Solirubrobacteraceae bacterium]